MLAPLSKMVKTIVLMLRVLCVVVCVVGSSQYGATFSYGLGRGADVVCVLYYVLSGIYYVFVVCIF